MDPASAAIAFVGFAGSIAQLAAVAVASCQTLHSVYKNVANAPAKVDRLAKLLRKLELIATRMRDIDTQGLEEVLRKETDSFWKQHAAEMQKDLEQFRIRMSKLEHGFASKAVVPKHLIARLRVLFSEEETTEYERIFTAHVDTATFMLSVTTSCMTRETLAQLKAQTVKVDRLLESAQSLQASFEQDAATRRILDSLEDDGMHLADRVNERLHNIPSDGCSPEERRALSLLQELAVTRSCVQAKAQVKHLTDQELVAAPENMRRQYGPDEVIHKRSLSHNSRNQASCLQGTVSASWQLSIHRYSVGVLTIYRTEASFRGRNGLGAVDRGQSSCSVTLSLFPAKWIATIALRLSINLSFPRSGAPSLTWKVKQAACNDDPELLRCLRGADVDGLCQLLDDGRARTTDILAPWGNSLLHEVVYSYMSGLENSLEMCQFLLTHGADPNCRNIKGRTPLLACCQLMTSTRERGPRLHTIASALIEGGANLALCDEAGFSACGLIMQSYCGLQYLESFVYRFVDLFTLQEMASSDAWILASLARTLPSFKARLYAEVRSYQTAPELSCSRYQRKVNLVELDVEYQVAEVLRASQVARTTFLESICANGTRDMLQPFINSGINLDELMPRKSRTYARTAAKQGNFDVLMALMEKGASQYVQIHSTIEEYAGPVEELLERWFSLRTGRPEYFGRAEDEAWVLPKLLLNETFDGPDVLFKALNTRQPTQVYAYLLDANCGRRDGHPARSWMQKVYGSEVIEAVKCNDPVIELMLRYGLALECHDRTGFTALLHALDRGPGQVNFVRLLIDAGADVTQRTASGLTPLELAKRNLMQPHPRMPRLSWTINKSPLTLDPVSLNDDQAAFDMLQRAIAAKTSYPIYSRRMFTSSKFAFFMPVKVLFEGRQKPAYAKQSMRERLVGLAGMSLMMTLLAGNWVWELMWTVILFRGCRNAIGTVDDRVLGIVGAELVQAT